MGTTLEVIGAVLTNAAGIAISPIPIIAVILMLMSPRAARLGLAFLFGWLVGILLTTTVFTLLADLLPEQSASGSRPVLGVVQLALGGGLLLLGWRKWRSRPAPDVTPELPPWMSKIDGMSVPSAAGLALALAAVNPKNLLVAAAAGATIGHGDLNTGATVVTIVVFSFLAGLTVLLPVLFALFAPIAAAKALTGIRTWLTTNNATIMTVLLVVLGVNVIGKGLGAF
ncbi:MAG: GAP family protein [Leucobacter sp.]|nr:GAP family protein [Leucobacter sp.]